MSNWPFRPLSEFLIEREGRFKPNDPEIASYKRLDKIDFSGHIHISDKPSKTDMIIIEPGDLVISGINVAKGALAVYEGNEPVTATIHYSSYTFNKNKIDIAFLKRFLKSLTFISELQDQVKGGIKTEIKPKHLLPLKARILELTEQQTINHHFDAIENEITELSSEVSTQSTYLTKLRQAILQEAIEGKLTADWRKKNPVRKGDPDYDAEALLDKIQAEKEKLIKEGKMKKQKPLAPIKVEEVPFELPEGWVWTRLGEVVDSILGKMLDIAKNQGEHYNYLRNLNVRWFEFDLDDLKKIRLQKHEVEKYMVYKNDLLICEGGYPGRSAIWKEDEPIVFQKAIHRVRCFLPDHNEWLLYNLKLLDINHKIEKYFTGAGIKHLTGVKLKTIEIPLPPISEMMVILERINAHPNNVHALEKQVSERKEQSEQLMQVVLREAFEGGK